MICKTCGGTGGEHHPSMFDKDGIGHPGHKITPSDNVEMRNFVKRWIKTLKGLAQK